MFSSTQATLIAREANRLGPTYSVYMDPVFVGQPTIAFVAPQLANQLPFDPSTNGSPAENPYTLHSDLQQSMNDLVGIIRKENEVEQAIAVPGQNIGGTPVRAARAKSMMLVFFRLRTRQAP